ncbi:MAG: sulfate adenylyltransferase subunit 1 [Kiritimatiellia bacterium]|jgi:sulfate adenylyltransferase subunit 1
MSHQSELIAEDINAYLAQHEQKELLRFITCGSVDDGKSTLIGRLLHDSKMIYEDQLAAIESDSAKHGTTGEKIDLALLVDGLQAEREQGITIDVAYRYFSTSKRKYIIADTPGHEQYTRNMATGASTCDLAVILIDARYGVQTQTRRHSYIASLLGVKHIVVAINKMDLVDFSEARFTEIQQEYLQFAQDLGLADDIYFVPMSALDGDNVVNASERSPWYFSSKHDSSKPHSSKHHSSKHSGKTLMEILEHVQIAGDKNIADFRFPVQYVNRPNLDFRGFCGTVASGKISVGDDIRSLPSGKTSKVASIVTYDGDLPMAFVGQAVTLTLEDEIDISRGDMIVAANDKVAQTNHLQAHVVWMSEQLLTPNSEYFFKFATKLTTGSVETIHHQIDVNTQEHHSKEALALNAIGLVDITLSQPVVMDPYKNNRATGGFIIIDRLTNVTVGAGMVSHTLASVQIEHDNAVFSNDLSALIKQHYANKSDVEVAHLVQKLTQYL